MDRLRPTIRLVGLLGLMLAPAWLHAQAPTVTLSADEAIRRAEMVGQKGDPAGAIIQLNTVAERYPAYPRVYQSLASWQEAALLATVDAGPNAVQDARRALLRRDLTRDTYRDGVRDLFDTYAAALRYTPSLGEMKARAEDLVSQEFPLVLGEYAPTLLPGQPATITYTVSDPQLPPNQWVRKGLLTMQPLPATVRYLRDPKYGQDPLYLGDPVFGDYTFQHMLYAYDFDRQARCWRLRFRVMWQDAPGHEAERTLLAQDTARFLLRLSGLVRAYTGLSPRFAPDGVVNVWLAEKGIAGGEAYNDNLYLHEVGFPRQPYEWVRELMHEYGHLTLQLVDGYGQPAKNGQPEVESGANGRLGERLFLRWLLRNPDRRADACAWMQGFDPLEARDSRIDALVRRFAATGPQSPALRAAGQTAMDGFVGMALYLDITQGSTFLANALAQMNQPAFAGPTGFLDTVETLAIAAQNGKAPVTLTMTDLPRNVPLWVYLDEGTWRGEFSRSDTIRVALQVTVDGTPCENTGNVFTTPALTRGWHKLSYTVDGGVPTFTALKLSRL